MILVYSNIRSSRLFYTLKVVFRYVLGVDYILTKSLVEFEKFKGPKFNYSNTSVDDSFQVIPSEILLERVVKKQNIEVDWIDEVPYFFKTEEGAYDILACCFWMVTRYEEYLPFRKDSHGRFKAEESLAYQHNFLKIPVVNIWCEEIKTGLEIEGFKFPIKKFSVLNTLDIDTAYFSKGKGVFRFLGSFFLDIIKNNTEKRQVKWNFLRSSIDVFDTFEFIDKVSKDIKTHYFFLLGDKSKYDHNLKHSKKCLKNLIQKLSDKNLIGIHPSYVSNIKKSRVLKEKRRLEKIIGYEVQTSRQHFLKLEFPKTYENLITSGIKVDYSMGFASQVGFRSGVCNAYPFYNLELEQEQSLFIVPFQVMDGTLNKYLELTPEQAIEEIEELIFQVKKVDGLFVSLWHNSSLSESFEWKGWRKVYEEMLNSVK